MHLDMYEEVEKLFHSEEKDIILVRHVISHTLFIKKIIYNSNDAGIYELLKAHTHPHIACVYEVERQDTYIQLIEEYINGVTLEYALTAHDFTSEEILNVMYQLLDAVEFLHHFEPPIIHRDLKPANIMIEDQQVKLIDFEIARLYKQEQERDTRVIGSPGFAAPEQYGFHQSDERSDIYALGTVLKYMCEHTSIPDIMEEKYASIIKRCMELDPIKRYQKIADMRRVFDLFHKPKERTVYKKTAHEFCIPGFANESSSKKLLIFIYYIFIVLIVVNMKIEGGTAQYSEIFMKIAVFLNLLGYLWIPYNVGGVLEILPLYRSENIFIRVLNGVCIYIILTFVTLLLVVLGNSIVESML